MRVRAEHEAVRAEAEAVQAGEDGERVSREEFEEVNYHDSC